MQVGTSPAGPIFVDSGRLIVTADSNGFDYKNISPVLTVVDVEAALNGQQGSRVSLEFRRVFSHASSRSVLMRKT